MLNGVRSLTAVVLICGAACAQAALTCGAPVSTGFATAYATAGVVPNVTQASVDVTCTRTAGGDPTAVYLRANNSNSCGGGGNTEAVFSGSCIQYEIYSDSGCTNVWTRGAPGVIPVSFTSVGTATVNVPVWACITLAGQSPAAGAGTYLDTIAVQIRPNSNGTGTAYNSATLSGSIVFPATCSITSITPVAFGTYVAFRSTPLAATGGLITLDCTNKLPYTMSLDAYSGVVVGLNYSLALSTSSSRGTGPGQTHTISGSMPANQAGTCTGTSCSGTNVHTLTVTY